MTSSIDSPSPGMGVGDGGPARFDVIAVSLSDYSERTMATDLGREDAEAFVKMAVFRRGVEAEFYKAVPALSERSRVKP